MTIRGDSFSSPSEVLAFTRYLLEGQSTFNSTTCPTLTEVEKFIDRASGHINVALAQAGFTPANVYANSTAKLLMDDWVTQRGAEYVELTQRGAGFNDTENNRWHAFRNMQKEAADFIASMQLGLQRLDISIAHPVSEGLTFTGLDTYDQRSDPDNTGRRQPFFRRGLFDNGGTDGGSSEDDE